MPNTNITINLPEPHYTLIDVKRDGLPEVIMVNDALLAFQHTEIFPWYLCISMEAQELMENGMPSEKESKLLFELGDEIESAVLMGRNEHGAKNAMFLARSTWNEVRALMFQVHDPEVAHTKLQALIESRTWERTWSYRMQNDPQWKNASFIFQLFPQARGFNA